MSTMIAALGHDKLTTDEKRRLARELECELAAEAPPSPSGITETQRAELRRRAALADADPDGGRPWEEIYAETKIADVEDVGHDISEEAVPGTRLTDSQRAELKRRIAHMEAHPDEWIPFEAFVEGTLKQYQS